ncbi:MAG: FecCD family ABC transporter permease [Bryobacteraceae bacterium]
MSHLNQGRKPAAYVEYANRKTRFVILLAILSGICLVLAISLGPVRVPAVQVLRSLTGLAVDERTAIIVHRIRLPHALAALLAGAGLSAAGAAMQSVLRNPLGSPFTLGISQAGAFGAAFAVMLMGTGTMQSTQVGAVTIINPWLTTASAFAACMATSLVIIAIDRIRRATPEVMVLSGVALGAMFSAGTMFLQYFADDVQLSAMVFWTFGDVGRAGWREVGFMAAVVAAGVAYFVLNCWNYNAIDAGDEAARSLGVEVERVRLTGMLVASLVTAVIVSFLGVIGFVGLICPHMVRRVIGDDHRFTMPAACLAGSSLLLASDTVARLIVAPHVLPVAVLTGFLGAPAFFYLLIRDRRR